MNRLWEEGDAIIKRYVRPEEDEGRDYVWEIIDRGEAPFLDARHRQSDDGEWCISYRASGCQSLACALRRKRRGDGISLPRYLKMMYEILRAVELAEEYMIPESVFLINGETVFYHGDTDSVRFLYVPRRGCERTTGELLMELLKWTEGVDGGFRKRWPMLERKFMWFCDTRAGRRDCMAALRRWQAEFPQEE